MKVSKELVREFDLAKSCDGATSAMAKKVLLLLSIQRELDIQIPAEQAAKDITLTQLAELVWTELERAPGLGRAPGRPIPVLPDWTVSSMKEITH